MYRGTAPTGANDVQLGIADNIAVGQYVTAADHALYRFDADTAEPSASHCAADCATKWPPLIVRRDQAVYTAEIDPSLGGFVERADGACQVTIAGWPVYHLATDRRAGDLLGQGVGGVWHAVTPTGGEAGVN
ncbi:secreted repeat protein with Y-X4-D motif [Nocardia tenerifensis]|uniref:Secreted repeat protein with Y-X4-D motif n=1 Tax=Nocardia tenerifensis TaxID=228006 RepID=A0A318KAE3_9NOCA|nr:secreted repeat protein with Y-X4-D motif [Nocardia tenerifensis]